MAGEVEEIEKALKGHADAQANIAYRTAGYAGNYSSQGGVTADADGQTPGLFSSPACIDASQQMVRAYQTPGAPRASQSGGGGGAPLQHLESLVESAPTESALGAPMPSGP